MLKDSFPEKAVEFNLRLEDETGENWRNAGGVISVELPKIAVDGNWALLGITPVKIICKSVEDMLAIVKAEETHLRVRVAEQVYSEVGAYEFKGRQHILTIEPPSVRFSPGIAKRGEPAYALCEFSVKKYTMEFDGEETFYASVEDGTLQIK